MVSVGPSTSRVAFAGLRAALAARDTAATTPSRNCNGGVRMTEAARAFLDGKVVLHQGDAREVLREFPDNYFHACVTDPPYALTAVSRNGSPRINDPATPFGRTSLGGDRGFMGQTWDNGRVAHDVDFWREVYRVLRPGAHLLAFGGTRTYHRLACAIEDAGFEIRDTIAWIYGQGFPKSLNVSAAIDKAAGAVREIIAPPPYTRGKTEQRYSETRKVSYDCEPQPITAPATNAAREWQGWGTSLKPAIEPIVLGRKPLSEKKGVAANVLRWGCGAINVDGCRIEATARPHRIIDPKPEANGAVYAGRQEPGHGFDGGSKAVGTTDQGRFPANLVHDGSDEVLATFPDAPGQQYSTGPEFAPKVGTTAYGDYGARPKQDPRGDTGSAARFFYTAKADADTRIGSKHPTVKPLDLMQYLVRLVTPKNGVVLDCFAGTGTTGEAAWREGMQAVLIEREEVYCDDITRRMELATCGSVERSVARAKVKAKDKPIDLGPLFGGADE